MHQEYSFSTPPRPLPSQPARPHRATVVRLVLALAIVISLPTLGICEGRDRDTQCQKVLLLDRRQWVRELASGAYFDDHHCRDRKSTRLNSSHLGISYAVFCLKKKTDDDTC